MRNYTRNSASSRVSILVNLAVGITVSLVLFSCAHPILRLMGLTAELMQDGMDYMRIVGAFAFFQALSLTLSASLRSANKAIYPMMVTVVVNILNIIGNYSLIFGRFGFPELGVEGAAISTASAGCLHDYTVRHTVPQAHPPFPTGHTSALFRGLELKNLMKVGLPPPANNVVQLVASRHHLLHQHAGSGSARHPYLLCQHHHVRLSVQHLHGTRRSICIGHLIGEKKPHAAFLMGKYVMKKSVMITVMLSCILALSGHAIFGWLTSNPDIIRMGATILIIDILLEIGRPINIFATTPFVQQATSTILSM